MKKAFTLVELLIVIVVIAILASLIFKIGGIGQDTTARNRTAERIQRLENALSGYYAAFGSYPPVQLEGRSRNIFYTVNGYGIQQVSQDPKSSINLNSDSGWRQVESACRAQPVAMEFPYSAGYQDFVKTVARVLKERHDNGEDGFKSNPALGYGFDGLKTPEQLSSHKGKADWTETQLFKFGLLSYLLPRYLVMMGHDSTSLYDDFLQWDDNNDMPARFDDGSPYDSWNDLNQDLRRSSERWKVALLPSQAITARWLVNFKNSLACNTSESYYGVDLKSNLISDASGLSIFNPWPKIYSSSNSQGGEGTSGSQQYALNEITMRDGWGRDLYYYSLPPYQSYRIWSAGPNGKTFPPWISPEELASGPLSGYRQLVQQWVRDDIVQLRN